MIKITEIEIDKLFYKSEKDVNGDSKRVSYTKKVKREVNVVSGGGRFGHYIIDIGFFYVISIVISALMYTVIPILMDRLSEIQLNLIFYGPFILYFFISESTTQRTIGKLATSCLVINEYGGKPSVKQIFIRTITRFIPFEAFSCINDRGWHDTWSNTYVVTKRELKIIRSFQSDDHGYYIDDRMDILD